MAIGSGSEGANTALQEEHRGDLTFAEAEVLVLKTLKQVMEEKVGLASLCKAVRARSGCSSLRSGQDTLNFVVMAGRGSSFSSVGGGGVAACTCRGLASGEVQGSLGGCLHPERHACPFIMVARTVSGMCRS